MLSLKDAVSNSEHDEEDVVSAIAYSNSQQQLAAGTTRGRVLVWQYTAAAQQWELTVSLHCSLPVARLTWSSSRPLLAVNHESTIMILAATDVSHHISKEVCIIIH